MTDDCTISFLLDDRDRLLEEIGERDIKIAELERAISLRDQLIVNHQGGPSPSGDGRNWVHFPAKPLYHI